ncbi:MAG: cobalt-precorrin-6A reductase [Rhodospirillales bacterium]|nr:cobalt-precorrin-6A reductase [Rhodospirillales bacterium]
MTKRILVLGGTTEAAGLARRIDEAFRPRAGAILSLAGRTRAPRPQPVATRSGGFGGAAGLADYLRRENIALVVDATHPFAAAMSASAREACARTGIPRLQWMRPPWTIPEQAKVAWAGTLAEAAAMLPSLSRAAFLSVGGRGLIAFAQIPNLRLVARAVERPENLPSGVELVIGRPPFTVAEEKALFRTRGVDTLVARESGGTGFAKIEAASDLGLDILLIRRPPPEPGDKAATYDAALSWIADRI